MSARTARRLLAARSCEIYVPKACSSFVTEPGIRDDLTVRVPRESILVPLKDIASISFEDRFGNRTSMEVEWE